MTGEDVTGVRKSLELEPFAFALLLGVHVSAVYRWEKPGDVTIAPLQTSVLEGLAKIPRGQRADLGRKIRDALVSGGTLAALYVAIGAITRSTK